MEISNTGIIGTEGMEREDIKDMKVGSDASLFRANAKVDTRDSSRCVPRLVRSRLSLGEFSSLVYEAVKRSGGAGEETYRDLEDIIPEMYNLTCMKAEEVVYLALQEDEETE